MTVEKPYGLLEELKEPWSQAHFFFLSWISDLRTSTPKYTSTAGKLNFWIMFCCTQKVKTILSLTWDSRDKRKKWKKQDIKNKYTKYHMGWNLGVLGNLHSGYNSYKRIPECHSYQQLCLRLYFMLHLPKMGFCYIFLKAAIRNV